MGKRGTIGPRLELAAGGGELPGRGPRLTRGPRRAWDPAQIAAARLEGTSAQRKAPQRVVPRENLPASTLSAPAAALPEAPRPTLVLPATISGALRVKIDLPRGAVTGTGPETVSLLDGDGDLRLAVGEGILATLSADHAARVRAGDTERLAAIAAFFGGPVLAPLLERAERRFSPHEENTRQEHVVTIGGIKFTVRLNRQKDSWLVALHLRETLLATYSLPLPTIARQSLEALLAARDAQKQG